MSYLIRRENPGTTVNGKPEGPVYVVRMPAYLTGGRQGWTSTKRAEEATAFHSAAEARSVAAGKSWQNVAVVPVDEAGDLP